MPGSGGKYSTKLAVCDFQHLLETVQFPGALTDKILMAPPWKNLRHGTLPVIILLVRPSAAGGRTDGGAKCAGHEGLSQKFSKISFHSTSSSDTTSPISA